MTEIQLKNIVKRLGKDTVTGTDGDEFTVKDGTVPESSNSPKKPWRLDLMLEKS
jgi:hypothetical protein